MKEIICGDITSTRYLGYRKKKDEGFFFQRKKMFISIYLSCSDFKWNFVLLEFLRVFFLL